ncbi:hypothetical protein AAKU52_002250 [Pedobacter sp. CG_S7]|uniref:Orn/Lys/Arg family decarboxylase n=1 Tax=Pedobacter sp. CG_S7 TaxID=3143930 RepID=UPI0033956993
MFLIKALKNVVLEVNPACHAMPSNDNCFYSFWWICEGENFGPADGPWLSYMRSLQEWRTKFPNFEKIVEGYVMKDETYNVWCLK